MVVGGASRTLRMSDKCILSMCIEVQSKSMELTNGGLYNSFDMGTSVD